MGMSYWDECIREALEELLIPASEWQTSRLVEWVEGAFENYGMAHGHDVSAAAAAVHGAAELRELREEIAREENWKASTDPCRTCTTSGIVRDTWGRDMDCPKCGGRGRVKR